MGGSRRGGVVLVGMRRGSEERKRGREGRGRVG